MTVAIPHEACWTVEPTSSGLEQAQRSISHQLLSWGLTGADGAAALCVAHELLTNSAEHAGTVMSLTIGLDCELVTIGVGDGSTGLPRLMPMRPDGRGWGLRLVEGLATRWWCSDNPNLGGKTVWAQVAVGA